MNTFFITGTDTDVGKTEAGVLILKELNKISSHTLGIKPISAGCHETPEGLRNDDALALQKASSLNVTYDIINPIAYAPFIAPHIAAQQLQQEIKLNDLQDCLDNARLHNPRWLLVEGAGGYRLPLNNKGQYYSDFALQNQMDVILVVGMRLGCLNHAILSTQAIKDDGLRCVGWVANQLSDDMPCFDENIASLEALLACPKIADIPYQPSNVTRINTTDAFSQVFA